MGYAQYRADKVDTNAHWHICLPHIPTRYQSKQKSLPLHPRLPDDKLTADKNEQCYAMGTPPEQEKVSVCIYGQNKFYKCTMDL